MKDHTGLHATLLWIFAIVLATLGYAYDNGMPLDAMARGLLGLISIGGIITLGIIGFAVVLPD